MRRILPYLLVIIISTGLSIGACFILFSKQQENKTGFIQLGKVYEDFELSKKLDAQYKQVATSKKNYLDSLEFQVKTLYTQVSNTKNNPLLQDNFEAAQRHYLYQKEQFEESVGAIEEEYNQQIWKQLNEYITQYGKEKGYNYIFGAEGSGTLMYGSEGDDLTQDMITYVNGKYQGK